MFQWFRSYLAGRSFRVLYCNQTPYAVYIVCSVSQWSVLGPRLFIFYMADLADDVLGHQVNMHTYADDTQLCLHCRHYDNAVLLETCFNGVRHWTAANRLKLNAEKTVLLWAGSRFSCDAQFGSKGPSVQFGTETFSASDHVRVDFCSHLAITY